MEAVEPKRTDGCPRKLAPGCYKRIPQDDGMKPVGFYVACPSCGFRVVIFLASEHEPIVERDGSVVSLAGSSRCHKCGREVGIEDGHFVR